MLALDRGLLEIFAKEILRGISASVPRVAGNWHHERVIFLVVRENALETVAQIKEVLAVRHFALQDLGLQCRAQTLPASAHPSLGLGCGQQLRVRTLGQILALENLGPNHTD